MKRLIDIVVALCALFLLWPLLLVISILVYFKIGKPIFFKQLRPGFQEKPFVMYKFRTMTDMVHRDGSLLPDNQRITPVGTFLRKNSLDELPELVNILWGDMSVVGPRPLLIQYLDRYTPEQARRHEVKPGLTGWAQVNGRNALSWEEKFKLDVWYVNNWSLWLDIKIIIMTFKQIFIREGISHQGEATMHEFIGSNKNSG